VKDKPTIYRPISRIKSNIRQGSTGQHENMGNVVAQVKLLAPDLVEGMELMRSDPEFIPKIELIKDISLKQLQELVRPKSS
jgi:hypothetical protein